MRLIIPLAEVRLSDAEQVGRKAATLGELGAMGFPIPPGLCVTTDAFRLAQASPDLTIPSALVDALTETLPTLINAHTPLAVRSSATLEDLPDRSFAGEYTTVLGARGIDEVAAAIQVVWQSFSSPPLPMGEGWGEGLRGNPPLKPSPSAHSPRVGAGAGGWGVRSAMAVLIQPLLDAECAGVCFSVDAVRGRRDTMIINAAWGQGIGVVDGSVPSDTLWLARDTLAVHDQHVADKTEAVRWSGDGLARVAVPTSQRRSACLPDAWAERIAQFVLAAETALGFRQDMEWAIADGQVWVLQSRPLTGLSPDLAALPVFPMTWGNPEHSRRLWSRRWRWGGKGLLRPLEEDLLRIWEQSNDDGRHFAGHDWLFRGRYHNGRAYFGLIPNPLPAGDRRTRSAALADLKTRLTEQGVTAWEHIGPEIVRATERLAAFDPTTANGPRLAEHLEDALGAYRRHWSWHGPLNYADRAPYFDAYAAIAGVDAATARQQADKLLDGAETPLTQAIDALYALAVTARAMPAVAALVAACPPDVMDRLAELVEALPLLAQLDQFMARYGDRTGDGWGSLETLGTPTWREVPMYIFRLAAPWLDPQAEAPSVARARAQTERDAQVEALCVACPDTALVARFRREWEFARRDAAFLELHNHYIDQLALGQARRAVLYAADWLVGLGALATIDDIFWLRFEEVFGALRSVADVPGGHAEVGDLPVGQPQPGQPQELPLQETIAQRQAQYATWAALEAPPFLGLPEAKLGPRPTVTRNAASPDADDASSSILIGLGASSGRRAGRARVVGMNVALPAVQPGDILVAVNAGPRWTPLFPILGGVVLDQGAVGQHAAATAREYGIPAVIGVGRATRRIKDGDWVVVDGGAGIVEIGEYMDQF